MTENIANSTALSVDNSMEIMTLNEFMKLQMKNGKDMDWENEEHENCKSDAETVSSKKYIFYK